MFLLLGNVSGRAKVSLGVPGGLTVRSRAPRSLSTGVEPFEPRARRARAARRGRPSGAYLCGRAGGRRWAPPCSGRSRARERSPAAPPPAGLSPAGDRGQEPEGSTRARGRRLRDPEASAEPTGGRAGSSHERRAHAEPPCPGGMKEAGQVSAASQYLSASTFWCMGTRS